MTLTSFKKDRKTRIRGNMDTPKTPHQDRTAFPGKYQKNSAKI
jgi:hypothetical protein